MRKNVIRLLVGGSFVGFRKLDARVRGEQPNAGSPLPPVHSN